MIVMKFGGTSVGIADHFRIAVREVERRRAQAPVVVVSALSGVTNLLVDFCSDPARRREITAALIDRHVQFAREVGVERTVLDEALDALRDDLERLDPGQALTRDE